MICRKTETLRELTETCWNEERVSLLLKLYRNLLHQVSADWNCAETFQFVSALLKLDWNLHIRGPLTESSCNYTIVSALLKLYRKFPYSFSSVSVLLKQYFSSSDLKSLWYLSDVKKIIVWRNYGTHFWTVGGQNLTWKLFTILVI